MNQLPTPAVEPGKARLAKIFTRLGLSLTLALALALIIGGGVLSGQASATETGPTTKPTIVIVHGGWADASGWSSEISRLTQAGYPVIAPADPLRGLTSDSDYIRSVLQSIPGPIVLVGHSYGGAVISNAARGVPNVKALVFIAAFAPDTGETIQGLVTRDPGTMITPDALDARAYPLPGGGEGTDFYIKKSAFHDAFAGDLPLKLTNLMWAEQRPFSVAAFTEPSGDPAWKTIPSWYLVSKEDHAIPPVTELFMARRAHAQIESVDASHVSYISHPDVTTALILKAAATIH